MKKKFTKLLTATFVLIGEPVQGKPAIGMSHTRQIDAQHFVTTEMSTGIFNNQDDEESTIFRLLRRTPGSKIDFPLEKIVVSTTDKESEIQVVMKKINQLDHNSPQLGAKVVTLPKENGDWFAKHHNIVYTVVRFVMNGTTIAATVVYAWKVPIFRAVALGFGLASASAVLQLYTDEYNQWLNKGTLLNNFGVFPTLFDGPVKFFGKNLFNQVLSNIEQFGKWSFVETSSIAVSRLGFELFGVGRSMGFAPNVINILKTSGQSILSQGLAVNAMFTDVNKHRQLGIWSKEYSEIFENTAALLISAVSAGATALELLCPGLGFGGFAFLGLTGVAFYIHSLR